LSRGQFTIFYMFIIDSEKIILSELKDHDIYLALHDLVLSFDLAGEIGEAQGLYNKLTLLLKGAGSDFDQELLGKYKKLLVLLQFISLPLQTDEVISKLFKENLLIAIYHGIDVKGKIELYIMFFSTNDFAERLSRIILKSLSENSERIGGKSLEIKGELKPLDPLVKNWLKDYINFSVNYRIRDDLSLSIYINQSKNIKQLSKKEVEVIIAIIKIYNFLHFPSAEKSEVKATGHVPTIVSSQQKVVEIDKSGDIFKPAVKANKARGANANKAMDDLTELRELAAGYPPGSLERKAVEEEIGKVRSKKKEKEK